MNLDNNLKIIGLIAILAGVLVIAFPAILAYVVGALLIAYGVLNLL